jgi:hypothetical protein
MWETGSPEVDSRRSASFVAGGGSSLFEPTGYQTRETTLELGGADSSVDEFEGDGFDIDEVFGQSSIVFPSTLRSRVVDGEEDSQESTLSSNGTAGTITTRLKRAFQEEEDEEVSRMDEDEDEEMAATDVEDEGADVPLPMAYDGPIGRKVVGRRGFTKTQSLPAHVFQGETPF